MMTFEEIYEKYGSYIIVAVLIIVIVIIIYTSPKQTTSTTLTTPLRAISLRATPQVTGRYVKVSKSSGYLMVKQITAYDSDGNSLMSMGATTSAPLSTDPITGSPPQLFMTGEAKQGEAESRFLTVDYGSNVGISKIIVNLRDDCCGNMMAGAIVKILDDQSNPVFTAYPLPMIGSDANAAAPENQNYNDNGSDNMYKIYIINPPDQVPVGLKS